MKKSKQIRILIEGALLFRLRKAAEAAGFGNEEGEYARFLLKSALGDLK